MKKTHSFSLLVYLASLALLGSCVSTETVDEPDTATNGEETTLVLNLSKPAGLDTRADESLYKLRYVAKLFQGSSLGNISTPQQRQEIADGDGNENQMVFKVTPDLDYIILVFADYIPKESQPDASGCYKDHFYDTNTAGNTKLHKVYQTNIVPATPINNYTEVGEQFFNNHNYDCFYAATDVIHKSKEEYKTSLELKRLAAMVKFVNSSSSTGEYSFKINNLTVGYQFETTNSRASTESFDANASFSKNITAEDKDVVFFYTLADATDKKLSISFTPTGGQKQTISNIPVTSNYQTLVKYSFLPEPSVPDPTPGPDTNPTEGDIILNLTTAATWQQKEM
ncbi:MAG: hypothetical protein J1F43_00325 [Muribaculaceae bacterium]|nr:hypothetical protein [Muribaculaceae bacterium]